MSAGIAPILIAAFGNRLAGDDAFGPAVAEQLAERVQRGDSQYSGVEVLDGGMQPAALLTELGGRARLIIVDAAWPHDVALPHADNLPRDVALPHPALPPAPLLDFDYFADPLPTFCYDAAWSTHGLGVAQQLAFARALGMLPAAIRLLAVFAEQTELGRALSPRVAAAIPAAVERVGGWIQTWNASQALP